MYHKVGLTAAFRLVNQVMKRETIVNGLSVAAKAALRLCFATQLLQLTIKHKLTLFRIRRVEVLPNFPNWRLKRK
jgi:hypothetical protein